MRQRAIVTGTATAALFEQFVLPHLDAAYNLARWMTTNSHDADDVVQEACLRAFRHIETFRGGNARAWLLSIVRNTCYSWLKRNRSPLMQEFDERTCGTEDGDDDAATSSAFADPQLLLQQRADGLRLNQAIEGLPLAFREVLVLRELEELSYREIADVVDIPVGTVMSRLARGRKLLQAALLSAETRSESRS